jgi:hypothetical protein
MPKHRKEDAETTTISILWSDKDKLRTLARPKKKTKNGMKYETDSDIFTRVITDYLKSHPNEVGTVNPTYPLVLQGKHQQGYTHGESTQQ